MTKRTFILACVLVFFMKSVFSQDIFRAVMSGDLNQTKILLEEHPDWANATSWGGWTPLHRAAQFGHGDIVDLLISKGSSLEAKTVLGLTPLYTSIIGQKLEVCKQLIDKGADFYAVRNDGETMLHIAAAMGQKDIVELLISKGLKVDVTRRYGITPLHLASVFGHKTTVEALISNGAEIDRKNDNGSTALHLAKAAGETQIVALLKEKGASDAHEAYVRITGEYLGQKKPGSTPELFAPGILFNTHRPHGSIAFSPDGKELYWAAALSNGQFQKIWMMRRYNGQWSPPEALSFEESYTYGGPAFSPDGERFFFDVLKPANENSQKLDPDIWFQKKNELGRSEVIKPGPPLNSDKSALGPTVSRNGNVYFYSFDIEGGFGSVDIYCSRLMEGGYEKPKNLGGSINTEFMDTSPYIAPDESYLLFSSMRPDGFGDFDLYVSYKKKDGTWTKARNMGDTINTPVRESGSVVSPDGKYLFFMSRRNGIGEFFWVDAKIIEELKPRNLFDSSSEDMIAYCRQPVSGANTKKEIYIINADGTGNARIIDTDVSLNHHVWSPDGQKLIAVGYATQTTWSIYIFNADGTNLKRLTNTEDVNDNEPNWSPDGTEIVFSRVYPAQNLRSELWVMKADGSNPYYIGVEGFAAKWSPDGSHLIYQTSLTGNPDLFTCSTDGSNVRKLTDTPYKEASPVYSPDGTRIAFGSNRDGNEEIYVMHADGSHIQRLTNNPNSDNAPRWSPDGSRITFHSGPHLEWEIFVMDSDGTNVRQVTHSPAGITAINPMWRPMNKGKDQ